MYKIGAACIGVVLGSASLLFGQAFTAKLLENRYGIAVRDGQFSGAGAAVLREAIAKSRFVLVGETHGLAETSKFWEGVCSAAGPDGFRTMAIEEGPLAAAELEQLARQPDAQAQFAAFEKQYPESIDILNTVEEIQMLQRCAASAKGGAFQLWGVNQEGLGAAGLILRRILDTRPTGEGAAAIRKLIQANNDAYAKVRQTGRLSNLFMFSADDQELAAAGALLQKDGSPQARALFASLIQSHEINRAWPEGAERRFRLMKTLFAADYEAAARSEGAPPKVLLKFGAFHVYRGFNPVHSSGIGNYVAELAEAHGAESLHISVMAVKGGQPGRMRPFNLKDDPGSRYLQPMLDHLLEADWTMFDLRQLRQAVHQAPGSVSPALADLIFGMDMVVMVPEGTASEPIR